MYIGSITFSNDDKFHIITALSYNPHNHLLYAIYSKSNDNINNGSIINELYSIDPNTAKIRLIGNIGNETQLKSAEFDINGLLYSWSSRNGLITIDINTASINILSNTSISNVGILESLSFDRYNNNIIYGNNINSNIIYKINKINGNLIETNYIDTGLRGLIILNQDQCNKIECDVYTSCNNICNDQLSLSSCLFISDCCWFEGVCNECITIQCSSFSSPFECASNPKYCQWNGIQCIDGKTECNDITDSDLCKYYTNNKIDCCCNNNNNNNICTNCNEYCSVFNNEFNKVSFCESISNGQCCTDYITLNCQTCNIYNNISCDIAGNNLTLCLYDDNNNCCFNDNKCINCNNISCNDIIGSNYCILKENCCYDFENNQCNECKNICSISPYINYLYDDCLCFKNSTICYNAIDQFGRECLWNKENSQCLTITPTPTYISGEECGYVTLGKDDNNNLNGRVPLDSCMKLVMNEDIFTLYTCYNNSIYSETFNVSDCRESSIITSSKLDKYYDYKCGLGGNCNYSIIYTFDRCDGNYFIDKFEQIPKDNYTVKYEIIGNNIYYDNDIYYDVTCKYGYFKHIFTPYPTLQPTQIPTIEPTKERRRRRQLLLLTDCNTDCNLCNNSDECISSKFGCIWKDTYCDEIAIDPYCSYDTDLNPYRIYESECKGEGIEKISSVSCGFVFFEDHDFLPVAFALNKCQNHWALDDFSFMFYCKDGKIYQNNYNNNNCNDDVYDDEYETIKFIDYDLASCADASYCNMVDFGFRECNNFTILDNTFNNTQWNGTWIVDVCFSFKTGPFIHSGDSFMWKCTNHSLVLYSYSRADCDDKYTQFRLEITTNPCIWDINTEISGDNPFYLDYINCNSPKCSYFEEYIDSYNLCGIFSNTDIDEKVNWWDIDINNYCDWEDIENNLYANWKEFRCYNQQKIAWLDLSDYVGIFNGTLNTLDYIWPNEMRYLNLAHLGLKGKWNWKSLKMASYSMYNGLDISNNNFDGTLDLQYIVGGYLWDIDISNNHAMYGYIDWESLGHDIDDRSSYLRRLFGWDQLYDFCSYFGLHRRFKSNYSRTIQNMIQEISILELTSLL